MEISYLDVSCACIFVNVKILIFPIKLILVLYMLCIGTSLFHKVACLYVNTLSASGQQYTYFFCVRQWAAAALDVQ